MSEQLAGTARVLEQVIAPEVESGPAADVLRGLVRNLRLLETSWTAILPFLQWDIAATSALLERVVGTVPAPLGARIEAALAQHETDLLDAGAVEARDDELRVLLAEVVVVLPGGPDRAAVVAHLDERARRYPLRMVPDMPRTRS